ncbi:MAG: hypothetical protein HYU37_02285 [Acidobacteria bacterium]|nr:hypothetical protein [Acidobacteriota bacterium]
MPTGAGLVFTASGKADDGDDKNGPVQPYADPARTAADARTDATSDPQTFRVLGGTVNAIPGPNPVRVATTSATNKAESTFTVTQAQNSNWELTTTFNALLNSARGEVQIIARLFDASNRLVPGSDFQIRFELDEDPTNPANYIVKENGTVDANLADGALYQDTTAGVPFALAAGNYTVAFEFNVLASADGQATIKAIGSSDLR